MNGFKGYIREDNYGYLFSIRVHFLVEWIPHKGVRLLMLSCYSFIHSSTTLWEFLVNMIKKCRVAMREKRKKKDYKSRCQTWILGQKLKSIQHQFIQEIFFWYSVVLILKIPLLLQWSSTLMLLNVHVNFMNLWIY